MLIATLFAVATFLDTHTRQTTAASLKTFSAKNNPECQPDNNQQKDKKRNDKFHCTFLSMLSTIFHFTLNALLPAG